MNTAKLVNKICQAGINGEDVGVQWPGFCGHQDAGKSRGLCAKHGHITLSVTPDTARKSALHFPDSDDRHMFILIDYPVSLHKKIYAELKVDKIAKSKVPPRQHDPDL